MLNFFKKDENYKECRRCGKDFSNIFFQWEGKNMCTYCWVQMEKVKPQLKWQVTGIESKNLVPKETYTFNRFVDEENNAWGEAYRIRDCEYEDYIERRCDTEHYLGGHPYQCWAGTVIISNLTFNEINSEVLKKLTSINFGKYHDYIVHTIIKDSNRCKLIRNEYRTEKITK